MRYALHIIRRYCSEMTSLNRDLRRVFSASVESVSAQKLISETVSVDHGAVSIRNKRYQNSGGCYLVGAGKAVLGMAVAMESALGARLIDGVVSVPFGMLDAFKSRINIVGSKLKFFEGARNNMPDEFAENSTKKIIELASRLTANDLLIVLLSGGGSALLTLPKAPITLVEKSNLIRLLVSKGANIMELNCVRKRMSAVKGGGLAEIAYPAKVVSLILSDIINDPVDFIASGPTAFNKDTVDDVERIFEKYSLEEQLSTESIKTVLQFDKKKSKENIFVVDGEFSHVDNFIVGNNRIAVRAAKEQADELGYCSCVLLTEVDGNVAQLSKMYSELACRIVYEINSPTDKYDFVNNLRHVIQYLRLSETTVDELYAKINTFRRQQHQQKAKKGICLIAGGETTVVLNGAGLGGRNQELALRFSLNMKDKLPDNVSAVLLSGGTDGIDGPTDAAGAIGFDKQTDLANENNLNAANYLENNDSYNFYSQLCNGEYHIKIGHTGTNVMDLHLLIINI